MSNRLTTSQIRGARGMLGWSMLDLATCAGVSVSTVKRIEDERPQPASDGIRTAIQHALERAGVVFLADVGDGPGMRLRPGSAVALHRPRGLAGRRPDPVVNRR